MFRLFEKKKFIVGCQIQTFLLNTKLRGKETEFAEAWDVTRGVELVLRDLEVILFIRRL